MKKPELKCCGKKVKWDMVDEQDETETAYEGSCSVCGATYSVLKGIEL
jgi:hypothetical protein